MYVPNQSLLGGLYDFYIEYNTFTIIALCAQ